MDTISESTIFIVDDNRILSIALKAAIISHFTIPLFKIHLFSSGEDCMKGFENTIPELVILDFHLNSRNSQAVDGLNVLNQIKFSFPETSVIMLTSNDAIDVALKSFHHGASDYVVKSGAKFTDIITSIDNVLKIRELVRQTKNQNLVALEQTIANKELSFYTKNKKRKAADLLTANEKLIYQNNEREKWGTELNVLNYQKIEMEKSRIIIEEKNKDITDSINYARRIQQAMLPDKSKIYGALPQSFVLFKPKAIVSGDFYFFHQYPSQFWKNDDGLLFIVAADCTGHGVPGALMSMIGSEKLSDAVAQSSNTSEILKYLNKGIKFSLQQSDGNDSNKDGMDMAVCTIDRTNRRVVFAGANRPFWLIRNSTKVVEEIKGSKNSIGGSTGSDQHFESHAMQLEKNDTFYIFTDGFADQFGGPSGKKLMSRNLKKILVEIQHLRMDEQKEYLNTFLKDWKADTEQVDDVLMIGVRI